MNHTTVTRSDDFGSAGKAESIRFSVGGQVYEIDLNKRNRETLMRRFEPYISKARVLGATGASNGTSPRYDGVDHAAVRAWLIEKGFNVSDRGVIPFYLLEEYEVAHAATKDVSVETQPIAAPSWA